MIMPLLKKNMRIGYHTWEPGLKGDGLTSAGGAIWTKALWKSLRKHNIQVDDMTCFDYDRLLPSLDALVLCWRWDFPNEGRYKERHESYRWQMKLIDVYSKRKTPIVVHDQDYHIDEPDLALLKEIGAHLFEPSLNPRPGFKSLHFPTPYHSRAPKSGSRFNKIVYVGNNYDRYDQFKRYMCEIKSHRPAVYGNWLETGIGRESPDQVKAECPNVDFRGRLDQTLVIPEMQKYTATIHFARPRYCENGFITIRWAEAVEANIVGLIPSEFVRIDELEDLYVTPDQVDIKLKRIASDISYLYQLLDRQSTFVNDIMRPYNWVAMLKDVTR